MRVRFHVVRGAASQSGLAVFVVFVVVLVSVVVLVICVSPLGRSLRPGGCILIAARVGASAFAKNAENSLPARENIGDLPAREKALAYRRAARLPCGA